MRVLVIAIALTFAPAVSIATEFLHGLRDMHYAHVEAPNIGRSFHIYTMLPQTYGDEPDREYPTIYLLDGGSLMPLLAGYYRYLRFTDETPEAIIVGISYGSEDFEGGNFRSTDFTAPSEQREYWGGAAAFQTYLANALLPHIESTYRSDPRRRVVMGHSLGGQFVLFSARTRPALFWGHIASNPALHRNLDSFLTDVPNKGATTHVFVAGAADEVDVYRTPRRTWQNHWSAQPPKNWKLRIEETAGHSHVSLPPVAFRQGLAWLYAVDSAD